MTYAPARWLPSAHAMTVFASVARVFPRPRGRRERWELPDGDFLDVDRYEPGGGAPDAPVLVICHGLEGSSRASYVRGIVAVALARGLDALALNFRGCSGEPNRLPRFYHSGETGDLGHVVARLAGEAPGRPVLLAGFSLGGNVVAKYVGEHGEALPPEVRGAAVISVPFDLEASARAVDGPGFWSFVYRERFMRRLRRKAAEKARRFPHAFDGARAARARTFAEFEKLPQSLIFLNEASVHKSIISRLELARRAGSHQQRAELLSSAGSECWNLGYRPRARSLLREALSADSSFSPGYVFGIHFAIAEGDTGEAKRYLTQARRAGIDHRMIDPWSHILSHLDTVRQLRTPSARSQRYLAVSHEYSELRIVESAIDNALLALTEDPVNLDAMMSLAHLYQSRKRYAPARTMLERAYAVEPQNAAIGKELQSVMAHF